MLCCVQAWGIQHRSGGVDKGEQAPRAAPLADHCAKGVTKHKREGASPGITRRWGHTWWTPAAAYSPDTYKRGLSGSSHATAGA